MDEVKARPIEILDSNTVPRVEKQIDTIYLIADGGIQMDVFLEYIEKAINSTVTFIESSSLNEELLETKDALFIVDYSSKRKMTDIANTLSVGSEDSITVLINVDSVEIEDLICWKNLYGCFGVQDSLDQVSRGLMKVLQRINWLPRYVMMELIEYFQNNGSDVKLQKVAATSLTRREMEILEQLKSGEPNFVLAQRLNVSENTIKVHLYNIYKKIEVKNRRQAIDWTTCYIP